MIEMRALDVGYGKKAILTGLNGAFEPGKLTALVGTNGCGKSTLLKTLVGLLTPLAGSVCLNGAPLVSVPPLERARRMGYLPQSRDLPALTALQMVLHGRYPQKTWPRRLTRADLAAADAALEQVGMRAFSEAQLKTLSGGQRQKVYLAMLLAQETDAVLLDEPTTSLDVACRLSIWSLCRDLARSGKTVLVVTHELTEALRYADELAVLWNGRLEARGRCDTVLASGILETVFSVAITRAGENQWCLEPQN